MQIKTMLPILIALTIPFMALSANAKQEGKSLPPGLQKKVDQGRSLPPGWQKKLEVGHRLDHDIYTHSRIVAPVDRHGYITVEIEDRRLRLLAATLEIMEILH